MSRLSLFWRVVIINALVFVVGIVALGLTVPTISLPDALWELAILFIGLAAIIVANALLLRLSFRPLERLTGLMATIDLLRPGQRLVPQAAGEVAEVIRSFNEMLDRLEAERRASSARALRAQEGERQRIARELHDEIGQRLTAVLLQLKRAIAHAPATLKDELLDVQEEARETVEEVRRIAHHLRPGVLEDLGLVSALNALGTTMAEQTGLRVVRSFDRGLPELGPEQELVFYRVAQEALTNAARHAEASLVELSLQRRGGGVLLRVRDDGRGLNGAVEDSGLLGMRERAILINGELTIASPPGGGVEVLLEAPVDGRL